VSGSRDFERGEEAIERVVGDELIDGVLREVLSALAAQRLRLMLMFFLLRCGDFSA